MQKHFASFSPNGMLKNLFCQDGCTSFLHFPSAQNKTPSAFANGVLEFNLDDDLLSHGETPHYHRRCIVSLLSSGWDQVVPMLYGRQEIRVLTRDQMASLQQIGYVTAVGVL
jgi:hypothetical protein